MLESRGGCYLDVILQLLLLVLLECLVAERAELGVLEVGVDVEH